VKHQNPALRAFHKRLIALRRDHPALHAAGFTPLHVGSNEEAYVYLRSDPASGASAVVALNFSDEPVEIQAGLPTNLRGRLFEDALSGKRLRPRRDLLTLALAPWDIVVLLPRRTAP
jgi:glycosidase